MAIRPKESVLTNKKTHSPNKDISHDNLLVQELIETLATVDQTQEFTLDDLRYMESLSKTIASSGPLSFVWEEKEKPANEAIVKIATHVMKSHCRDKISHRDHREIATILSEALDIVANTKKPLQRESALSLKVAFDDYSKQVEKSFGQSFGEGLKALFEGLAALIKRICQPRPSAIKGGKSKAIYGVNKSALKEQTANAGENPENSQNFGCP